MIENGANINAKDPNGNSLLANAVMHFRNDESIIKFLLNENVDPTLPNSHGISLLSLMQMPKNEKIRPLFKKWIKE